jgi:hypothetical protein
MAISPSCGERVGSRLLIAAAGALALVHAGAAAAQTLTVSTLTTTVPDGRAASPTLQGGGLVLGASPIDDIRLDASVNLRAGETADGAMAMLAPLPGPERPWRKLDMQLRAAWEAPLAKLNLALGQTSEQQALWSAGTAPDLQSSRSQSVADARLQFAPAAKLNLELGGRLAETSDAVEASTGDQVRLRNAQTTGEAKAQWTLAGGLTLHVEEKLGYASLSWQGPEGVRQDYTTAEPAVGATITPWSGAAWSLSLGHEATPLDASAFVAVAESLARAEPGRGATDLAPNQAWVAKAELDQALPIGRLRLGLTRSRLGSTLEPIRLIDGADAPGVIFGGERRQFDVSLAVPLTPAGLRGLSLETGGRLRDSSVLDPITGTLRRLSGETPYDAHIGLTQEFAPMNLRLGVQAQAIGASTAYTADSAVTQSDARTLGLFVEYRPAAFALRLQVDGLAASRRDVVQSTYDVSRATDFVVRTDRSFDDQASVSLVLRKPL